MAMAYRLIPGGYIDETGPHRGSPPTPDDFQRASLSMLHRTLFTRDLHVHLDMMSTENAKKMYKAMESASDTAGKYFFNPE